MLVCNVSVRPPARTIAADLAETAAALDDAGGGQVVFATLVDDPASVGDFVDAYSGEIMLEAASADAAVDAGLVYLVNTNEATTAADLSNAGIGAATPTTTTSAGAVGPLFVFDATFPRSLLTVINAGR